MQAENKVKYQKDHVAISNPHRATSKSENAPELLDTRFRDLLGKANWAKLPNAIRRRFGKKYCNGASVAYQGKVVAMRMNWAGKILANCVRLIGSPLPYDLASVGQPAVVIVTEDVVNSGQFWVRQYSRRSGFPQLVQSSKRFAGPTGLEEYLGYGISMSLRVEATDKAILFHSHKYLIKLFGLQLQVPKFLAPGDLIIGHHDKGDGFFLFTLDLNHPIFGKLINQDALFRDT